MDITITGLSHELRGIGHLNGKTVFVEAALPDETVSIDITRKNSKFNEGRVTQVITPSPDRIIPHCQHFAICGGCQLQHISPEKQILLKQANFVALLNKLSQKNNFTLLEPLSGSPWGYRDKTRLSIKYVEKKEKLLIGFHEKNGRFVADLTRCDVLNPKLGEQFELLRNFILSLSNYKHIPQIEASCDQHTCALIIRHLTDFTELDYQKINNFKELSGFDIYCQPNNPELISPMKNLSYIFKNITYHFQPTDFIQINPEINQLMLKQALELLDINNKDIILDLFCGLGNFTLPLSQHCQWVTGIEGDKTMVQRAKDNAKLNNIHNIDFYYSNLFKPEFDLNTPQNWMHKKYTKIIIDPPRTGAIEILPFVQKKYWDPELILYVSCNPATFARDAAELVNTYGFELIKTGIIDMFTHTKHVESMSLFRRVK